MECPNCKLEVTACRCDWSRVLKAKNRKLRRDEENRAAKAAMQVLEGKYIPLSKPLPEPKQCPHGNVQRLVKGKLLGDVGWICVECGAITK